MPDPGGESRSGAGPRADERRFAGGDRGQALLRGPAGRERAGLCQLYRDAVVRKRSKKAKSGFTEVDLIPLIQKATVEERRDTVTLDLILRAQNPGLNPELIVSAIRGECPQAAPDFALFHRRVVLDEAMQVWE